jgi:iron uptake system component EfeO
MKRIAAIVFVPVVIACGPDPQTAALDGVKGYVTQELGALADAAVALQVAAPAPDADGWNATADAAAVTAMKAEWKKARISYERVEGAIAVLFPDLDAATDERYDGFIAEGEDTNLFDSEGVSGIHAIERILFSDSIPQGVIDFESGLPGYVAAAFPANETEATDFKNALCQRLVDDTASMRDQFAPLALDTATAYRGVIGSMEEQIEKVSLASTGEDESRYAQHTLADMRANLEGGVEIFAAFNASFEAKGAVETRAQIEEAFARIDAHYDGLNGDAIPPVPSTWNPDAPSDADLQTEYGQLFTLLSGETDPATETSLVSLMLKGADQLGVPQLPE